MKVIPTELHVWKVWLNSLINAIDSNKWYCYVLASTASRAAKMAIAEDKQWRGSSVVVISVKLVCSSLVVEPVMITKQCVKYEKERKEEIRRQKDLEAVRAKHK